jgi:hypothetical protein
MLLLVGTIKWLWLPLPVLAAISGRLPDKRNSITFREAQMHKFQETFLPLPDTWHEDAADLVREAEEAISKHKPSEAVGKFEQAKKIHEEKRGRDTAETAWMYMKLGDAQWASTSPASGTQQHTSHLQNAYANWHWAHVLCIRIFGCMCIEQLSLLSRKIAHAEWKEDRASATHLRQLYMEIEEYNLLERNPAGAVQPVQPTS